MNDETEGMHQAGSNISKLKEAIANGMKRINQQKANRQACNEEIAAVRADLEAKGINKKAFDMAMKAAALDPEDRKSFDIAYDICREAMGVAYNAQGDLFTDTKEGREADRPDGI